jgi:hypothetical protein
MPFAYIYTDASRMRVIIEEFFFFEESFPLQEFFLPEEFIFPEKFLQRICLSHIYTHMPRACVWLLKESSFLKKFFPFQEFFLPEGFIFPKEFLQRICFSHIYARMLSRMRITVGYIRFLARRISCASHISIILIEILLKILYLQYSV